MSLSLPVPTSFASTVGIAAAYATGASAVVGWSHIGEIFNLYYFALQWITAAAIRIMVLRVADSVDTARADRIAVELQQEVSAAVREYDREQMRLLHDTVASTLLMVGDGMAQDPERVAAQARRDLEVFSDRTWTTQASADLVAALRRNAEHMTTPVTFTGVTTLWLDGTVAATVAAAAREALTNVDRHAAATAVRIAVGTNSLHIADNGRGFDSSQLSNRHGISNSITARMRGLGGDAVVTTQPGLGTTVELCWPTDTPAVSAPSDPERLIERTRTGYGLALTAYAIANLLAMVAGALQPAGHRQLQWTLASVSAAATLSAITRILGRPAIPPRLAAAALLIVSVAQSATLPVDLLGTQAQWSQAVIGWCVLPLILDERLLSAVAIIIGSWCVPGIYTLIRDPSTHTITNLGYGTASILTVQLCALLFDNLIRQAAQTASAETETRARLTAAARIADAVQAEYQRRYAELADTIRPVLTALTETGAADAAIQQRARVEYQRLRALFDQTAAFDHVLLQELRPLIDSAQDRGIAVSVTVGGTLPAISDAAARNLVEPIGQVLVAAPDAARITVTGRPATIELSVICHGVPNTDILTEHDVGGENVNLTELDGTVWITVQHRLPGGPHHHALAVH